MHEPNSEASDPHSAWRRDIAALPDDELLALAYTFSRSTERLQLYLQQFRSRVGARAQFAACLMCYDLAQKGDAQMAEQFAFLQGTLHALSRDQAMVAHLVGEHQYLCALWAQCAETLKALDGGDAANAAGGAKAQGGAQGELNHDAPGMAEMHGFERPQDAQLVGSIHLLDDQDLDPAALQVDEEAMWRSYVEACEQFFGSGAQLTSYDGSMGFRFRGHQGQARAQAFDLALEHCQAFVAPARGMRPLLQLAWGLSLRAKGLLGQPNKRRQYLLTAGLQAFLSHAQDVAPVARLLGPLYADEDTWKGIANLLLQYGHFVRQQAARASDPTEQGATSEAHSVQTFVATGMLQ